MKIFDTFLSLLINNIKRKGIKLKYLLPWKDYLAYHFKEAIREVENPQHVEGIKPTKC